MYTFSQRAEHMYEKLSVNTTCSRAIITARDVPYAEAARYRRLHVIVGDSTMCEATTLLATGSTDLVLRLLESGRSFRHWRCKIRYMR